MSEKFAVQSITVTSKPFARELAKHGERMWHITVVSNIGTKQCAMLGAADGFNWQWFVRAVERWIAEPQA